MQNENPVEKGGRDVKVNRLSWPESVVEIQQTTEIKLTFEAAVKVREVVELELLQASYSVPEPEDTDP